MAKATDSSAKKYTWSGEEVGKALLTSTILDIKYRNDPDYKPILSQADFEIMENSLSTDEDYLVYGVYKDIYGSILDAYNRGQGFFQQFYNGYSRFTNYFYLCLQADDAVRHFDEYPLVMTRSQYERCKEKAGEKLKAVRESFGSVLFHVLSYFMAYTEEAPESVREAIKAAKQEIVTNQRILSVYKKIYGSGYYRLPDGRRSDEMSLLEWQKALHDTWFKLYCPNKRKKERTVEGVYRNYCDDRLLKSYRLFYNGITGIKQRYKELVGKEMPELSDREEFLLLRALEDLPGFYGEKNQNENEKSSVPLYSLEVFLSGLIEGHVLGVVEWLAYEESPKITKYQVLTEGLELCDGARGNRDVEGFQYPLDEFMADYPALYKALEAYLKKIIPAFREMNSSDYLDEAISRGELADVGIANYRELTVPTVDHIVNWYAGEAEGKVSSDRYSFQRRANCGGIAIIQEPAKEQIDENGDYKKASYPVSVTWNLYSLAASEIQKEELDFCQNNLFKPALRFLYAFNALMKIIGAVYDIADMEAIRLSTETFESQLNSFNNLIYIFYGKVYGSMEDKKLKRKLIKELFPPVDIEGLKPTKEAIEAVTAELRDLGFTLQARKKLKNFDRYIALLMGEGE